MSDVARTKHQQKTRSAFIKAFVHLVIQRGFDQITVTDIANEADYGRWAFYQYFESKEAVAWAAFEQWMSQLDQNLVQAVMQYEYPRREYESWRLIFRAFYENRSFLIRLDSLRTSLWRERAKELLVSQFMQHLSSGQFALMEGVRPEIAARLYVAAFMEILEFWGKHPDYGDYEAMADEFFTFIFNRPPPSPKNN